MGVITLLLMGNVGGGGVELGSLSLHHGEAPHWRQDAGKL